jgi:uncharacterized membrane protein YgdD (TMEM256/DUF423 family)
MRRKSTASLLLSLASIGAQFIGSSCASSGAVTAARGSQVSESVATAAAVGTGLAMCLAPLALVLALISWSDESPPARVLMLCLSIGAVLFSFLVV